MSKYADIYRYYFYAPSQYYGSANSFVSGSYIPKEGFSSLYAVTSDTKEAIGQEGTTRFFKGVVWSPHLIIDCDTDEATQEVGTWLDEKGYSYDAFTTGNRGMHFYIATNSDPSHLLPLAHKQFVQTTFKSSGVDTSIYTHLHLFRLPGTVHEKTGRPKELFHSAKGKVLEIARATLTTATTNTGSSVTGAKSVFNQFRIMSNTVPVSVGLRHETLVKLCYALKDDAQVDGSLALWWLLEANKLFNVPKPEEDVEKILNSIYNG